MGDQQVRDCDCFEPQHWLYPSGGTCPKCGGHIPKTKVKIPAGAKPPPTVSPARKDYVRSMLIDIEVSFREAMLDVPYSTRRQIHVVDSLDNHFHEIMNALRITLGVE